jgi:hypothetical protein
MGWPMKPPRVRLWTLLVAVAALAVPLWGLRWLSLRGRYRDEAALHAQLAEQCAWTGRYIDPRTRLYNALSPDSAAQLWGQVAVLRDGTLWFLQDGTRITDEAQRAAVASRYLSYAAEHDRLERAYRRAARYPWSSAPPEELPHEVPVAVGTRPPRGESERRVWPADPR